jgi:hypothetical protein
MRPRFDASYGTATTISAMSGAKRDSTGSVAGKFFRNLSVHKPKRGANLEVPNRMGELSSFSDAHEHGLDSLNPVAQGYDDKPHLHHTRLESPSPPASSEEVDRPNQPNQPNLRTNGGTLATLPNRLSQPVPSTTITIRRPPAAATTQDSTGNRALDQPFGYHQSPDHSSPPSFVFFPDENDEQSLVRVPYRSIVSFSSEELLSPVKNPSADNLRKEQLEQQKQQAVGKHEPRIQESRQPGSVRDVLTRMQSQGHAVQRIHGIRAPRPVADQRVIDRNCTSRMDSPTPSNSSSGSNHARERLTFNDAITAAAEEDMNLNISRVNGPALRSESTPERPHSSPQERNNRRHVVIIPRGALQASSRPPPSTTYRYTPSLRLQPSGPTLRHASPATVESGSPIPAPSTPTRMGAPLPPSPGPPVRGRPYAVATPWAPDNGAGPGDFPVAVFAGRDSVGAVRSRSASDGPRAQPPSMWSQQNYGQDAAGIGRPRIRKVSSREGGVAR